VEIFIIVIQEALVWLEKKKRKIEEEVYTYWKS
jgi:hypothetical protein